MPSFPSVPSPLFLPRVIPTFPGASICIQGPQVNKLFPRYHTSIIPRYFIALIIRHVYNNGRWHTIVSSCGWWQRRSNIESRLFCCISTSERWSQSSVEGTWFDYFLRTFQAWLTCWCPQRFHQDNFCIWWGALIVTTWRVELVIGVMRWRTRCYFITIAWPIHLKLNAAEQTTYRNIIMRS